VLLDPGGDVCLALTLKGVANPAPSVGFWLQEAEVQVHIPQESGLSHCSVCMGLMGVRLVLLYMLCGGRGPAHSMAWSPPMVAAEDSIVREPTIPSMPMGLPDDQPRIGQHADHPLRVCLVHHCHVCQKRGDPRQQ